MGRIAIVSASLGAGHDGAAHEIGRRLAVAGHDVTCYDFLDLLPWGIGKRVREAYRKQLDVAPGSWEWLLNILQRRRTMSALTVWLAASASKAMRRVLGSDVDAVVCTYPLASQVAMRLRRRGKLSASVITYLTDPSVHPLWMAEGTDLYLAAHPEIAAQVRMLGAERVAVVAPAVKPEFRPVADAAERAVARKEFDLPDDKLLALVVSGSWAVGEIEESAREVAAGGVAIPVVVCGENVALRERLRDLTPGYVLGWVNDMPALLRACDIVVLNSGGLTFFEAHAAGVPVLTYRCLAGHGRTNARSLEHAGLARWLHDRDELTSALTEFARTHTSRVPTSTEHRPIEVGTACPTVAITGLVRQPFDPPPRDRVTSRRVRRLAWVAASVAWLLWVFTSGTSLAVAHGFRAVGETGIPANQVFFVVEVPADSPVSDQDIGSLSTMNAAVAVSVQTAADNPGVVRRMATAGLLMVNSAGGQPYETGWFAGRGAIGAGARAIDRLTTHRPKLMLSNGDLDAVDVSLAAIYGERIIIPKATLSCGSITKLPARGGIVLIRQDQRRPCDLDSMLAGLNRQASQQNLHPTALRNLTT
ncbi:MAG TPA: glycosyltransferase [Pseudonocardiaceae bacterium]|nr:glycosyltransferase [Pseudonocardiaceae bacterium]